MGREDKNNTDEENNPDISLQNEWNEEDSPMLGLSDSAIEEIETALHDGNLTEARELITELSIADSAELLEKLSEDDRSDVLEKHSDEFDPLIFAELAPDVRKTILESMPARDVAAIISELDSDDALEIVRNLSDDFRHEIIRKLSAKIRLTVEEGLSFPEDSAGRLMQRQLVAIPQFWTVGKTIDYLREAADDLPEDFFDIFVISPTYHVAGEVALSKLIKARRTTKIEDLITDKAHPIPATMDQEEVARIFRREDLTSAPVVDEDERLIGVITIDDVVDVIDEEAEEDIFKLAGIDNSDLYSAVLDTTGARFRWLFINMFTAILASLVIAMFDDTINQLVALAILMPIVASMGGNAGTQALTIAVRALATRKLSRRNTLRVIWKEVLVGLLNGIAFAVIMGMIVMFWFENPLLGVVIGSAMIVNLIAAGLFGAGIPIILDRMGSDPAVSSTVLLTTVTDVVGFFVFLGLAALFLI